MNLSTFWKRPKRHTYRFILKSGAEFRVSGTNLKIEWDAGTMQLKKWELTGGKGEVPFHLSPLEVAAIVKVP